MGGGGSQYKSLGLRGPEECPGPDYFAYVYVFLGIIITCRVYELTHSDQAQVTLQMTQSFRFSVNISSWSALVGSKSLQFKSHTFFG